MKIEILMITTSIALFFLTLPQTARAQKDGEAQAVKLNMENRLTLEFANEPGNRGGSGQSTSPIAGTPFVKLNMWGW